MYSPAAMLKMPASVAARPATSTANGWPVAPPTVLTTANTLVRPSWAPKTASRISLSRLAARRSWLKCCRNQAESYWAAGTAGC